MLSGRLPVFSNKVNGAGHLSFGQLRVAMPDIGTAKKPSWKSEIFVYALLLVSMFTSVVYSQVLVEGQVHDAETEEPVVATITVQRDTQRWFAFTRTDGRFTLMLPPGIYQIVISAMGYKPDTLNHLSLNEDTDLGVLFLKRDTQRLPAVDIRASTQIPHLNKDVYILTDSMRRAHVHAREILQQLPTITYDPLTNALKVAGSSNVLYLVDGVERSPQYVLNMDPKRIQRIEVIRIPTGRFAFEGYDAIIQIITRQHYSGYDVTLSPGGGTNFIALPEGYTQTDGSFTGTVTMNRWTLSAEGVHHGENFPAIYRGLVRTPDWQWEALPEAHQPINSFMRTRWSYGEGVLSYALGAGQHAGVKVRYQSDHINLRRDVQLHWWTITGSQVPDTFLMTITQDISRRYWHITGFYRKKFASRVAVEIQSEWTPIHIFSQHQLVLPGEIRMYSLRDERGWETYSFLTVRYPGSRYEWTGGYILEGKWSAADLRQITEQSAVAESDSQALLYRYRFVAHRLFVGLGGSPIQNWRLHLQAGVSLYRFHTGWGWEFFPMVSLFRKWKNGTALRIHYQVERKVPTAGQQAPLATFTSLAVFQTGNPDLKPYYEHTAYAELRFLKGMVYLKPYLTYAPGKIYRVYQLWDSVLLAIPQHSDYLKVGGQISGLLPVHKRVLIQLTAGGYVARAHWQTVVSVVRRWVLNTTVMLQFPRTKTRLFLHGERRPSVYVHPQGHRREIDGVLFVGLEQVLLKRCVNLRLFYAIPAMAQVMDLHIADAYRSEGWQSLSQLDVSPVFARGWSAPLVICWVQIALNKGYVRKLNLQENIEVQRLETR